MNLKHIDSRSLFFWQSMAVAVIVAFIAPFIRKELKISLGQLGKVFVTRLALLVEF